MANFADRTIWTTDNLDPPFNSNPRCHMPHQTEPSANNALAVLLRRMLSGSAVWSETTHSMKTSTAVSAN